MGTVGLSFGSPTSGTGFDVSSTVAEIVSNLRNVEAPWKTQLTTLESQDTVISSLGTLYSNLSNDMSSLTDFQGILAEKTGSSSDNSVLELSNASSSAVAGTHTITVTNLAQTSSGYLTEISKASDTLSGSITLQVGSSGTAQTIDVDNLSDKTLSGLAAAINSSGVGIIASVLTDSSGSRLSLVSGTSGAGGDISVSSNSIVDGTTSLTYTSPVAGKDAQLTVDGVSLTSASNTISNLIPGVTFQLLAPSATESGGGLEQIQVIIGNDNSAVESTMACMVSDYNSLISAINTQEGKDSSGNNEPLFGSPTLSLLQQQLLGGLNTANPNGFLDAISTTTDATLSGSISIAVGSGTAHEIDVPSTSGDNTLSGLAAAINSANIGVTASVETSNGESTLVLNSGTDGTSGALAVTSQIEATSDTAVSYSGTQTSSGSLDTIASSSDTLSGSISIAVGSGTAQEIDVPSTAGDNTLSGLADAINAAGLGVTATLNSSGTALSLVSQTAGSGGALTVTPSVLDTSQGGTALNYTDTQTSSGSLDTISKGGDTLSGSMSIQVGSGPAKTFDLDSLSDPTLSSLVEAINAAGLGVAATLNSDGTALSLLSQTAGSGGTLKVTSSILDTSNTNTAKLNYTNSSDITSLTSLGISVNNDGSLTFDDASLDSVLNSDFGSVAGFFQGADSWGMTFSNMLTNSGTGSSTGILKLAENANSSSESSLNADISKEDLMISAQQTSLTAELTSANEIMQELPLQLDSVNELYSAITGYNQTSNG
jgi:flagellar hook-associated protein 2